MVKRVPAVSQICRHRPSGIGRIPGSTGNIRESRPESALWPSKPQPISMPCERIPVASQTGILALPIGNYFRRTGNYLRRDGNCAASSNPPDFARASRPRRHPVRVPSPSQACRQSDLLLNNGHSRSPPKPPSYTANWAILPSPCPASGTIVCLEAPLAGLVPAIHAFLCLADRGLQDVDARIKSGQGVF